MRERSWGRRVGALVLLLCTQCSGDGNEAREPLEVRVLAAGTRIEVYTREPGDCHAFGEFRDTVACESMTWRVAPLKDCVAPSCVSEMWIEQESDVIERSGPGRFAAFDLDEDYRDGAKLIIDNCGKVIELPLPAPKDDVEFRFTADSERIELSVDGPSAGTFTRASTYAFSEGYAVACQASAGTSVIPADESYSFYQAAAFAFDDPVLVENDLVRAQIFPSAYAVTAVSTRVDLGPLWEAAVAAAQASSLWQSCADACTALTTACGEAADQEVAACAAPCVAAGEATPSCVDEYRARVECVSANAICDSAPTANTSTPCDQADADWAACAEP